MYTYCTPSNIAHIFGYTDVHTGRPSEEKIMSTQPQNYLLNNKLYSDYISVTCSRSTAIPSEITKKAYFPSLRRNQTT